jgi:predicted ATPase
MLTRLDIKHFKCFELLKLPLAPLTLLSGSNASGKSSALQALVLLHQTMREHEWSTRVMLNGETLRLGTVLDVVDKVNGRRTFEVGLLDAGTALKWSFTGEERDEMSMTVDSVSVNGTRHEKPETLRYLLPPDAPAPTLAVARRIRDLTYITAERLGPREVYPLEDRLSARVVGPQGEHAASLLYRGRDERVIPELAIEGVAPTRLHQVTARMRNLFPGCGIIVQQVPQANAVSLGMRTSDDTDFHRPIHVGFGLTQVLPIIVAALSASRDDILLIENPEVHLHPSGQALIGQFLAEVAVAGVQVVIETHSDHVLNGIRRAVKGGTLTKEQAVLHFFRPRGKDHEQVASPNLDSSGNIDAWPEGFFDQFDKDMNHFAGWES